MAKRAVTIFLISIVFIPFVSPSLAGDQVWVDEIKRQHWRSREEIQRNQEDRMRTMDRRREELIRDHKSRRRAMEKRGQAIERDFETKRKIMVRER